MKLKLYFQLLLAYGCFFTISFNSQAQQRVGLKDCRSMDYSFSYPANWEEFNRYKENATIVASPTDGSGDPFHENVSVIWKDLSEHPLTLDEYAGQLKKDLTATAGENVIVSQKRIKVNGQPADEVVYTTTFGGKDLKIMKVSIIAHNVLYTITYTADPAGYEKHLVEATSILNSFKLNAV